MVLDFHADWCAPCKQLTPILAAAVKKTAGAVLLATVDVDKNRELAQSFRVKSLPTVAALWQGQPVSGFVGGQSAKNVATFVAKLHSLVGGDEEERKEMTAKAFAALAQRDTALAAQIFSALLEQRADNGDAIAGLTLCYLHNGDAARAAPLLESVTDKDNKYLKRARAFLRLLEREDESPQLQLFKRRQYAQAVEQLLTAIAAAKDDKKLRGLLLEIFSALGDDNPITAAARRRLSALLFS